jgi:hypothetical protein
MLYVRKTPRKNYIMAKREKQGQVLGFKGRETAAGWPAAAALYDSLVSDLGVVVLVEEGTHDVVNQFVFAVGDVKGKGRGKEDECDQYQLAEGFQQERKCFFHFCVNNA